jgi:ribulose-phosphate 3-epimerase
VENAMENFDIYTKLSPRRIVFHVEAVGDMEEFQNFLEGIDTYVRDAIDIGVAISPTDSIEKIYPLVNFVDFVQCMGIDREGIQGEKFDPKCLEQIKKLKEKFSDVVVSVDGAVNGETAPRLIEAGANRLVIGSAIFNTDDIIERIEEFKQL